VRKELEKAEEFGKARSAGLEASWKMIQQQKEERGDRSS